MNLKDIPEKLEVIMVGILFMLVEFAFLGSVGLIIWWAIERNSSIAAYITTGVLLVFLVASIPIIIVWAFMEVKRRLERAKPTPIPRPPAKTISQLQEEY